MNIRNLLLLSLLVTASGVCRAQGYYDDDIYFDASKDKDKNIELAKKQAKAKPVSQTNGYILYPVADFASADTYAPEGNLTMSVDDYNRRGIFATDSVRHDSTAAATDFAYTRQIERFYNPAIVKGSSDKDLAQLYYAQPANVNIYINTPAYGYWGYPYRWNSWYDPWFYGPGYWPSYSYWNPYYGWGCNYPFWSPGWGPAWAWGPAYWGPGWGWGASWGWCGVHSRPVSNRHPGAIRNPRPGSNIGNHRPGSNSYRPAYSPGRHPGSNSNYRPSYNNSNSNGYRPGYNTNSTNSNSNNNNSYTRPGRHNSNSYTNSNRGSSGSSYRSSGGHTGGGSSSGGGGGRGRH
ncbi:MAG: hypothetical protein HFJ94_01440 [Muribaculaceae bacterium]|nr:hypothetical protein [Muribaculaceae bacterium]